MYIYIYVRKSRVEIRSVYPASTPSVYTIYPVSPI